MILRFATQGGTEAVTRVVIDGEDKNGVRWSTVGVSPNIVDASFEALLDAINWKLVRDTNTNKICYHALANFYIGMGFGIIGRYTSVR